MSTILRLLPLLWLLLGCQQTVSARPEAPPTIPMLRLWDLANGALLRTYRPPIGPGDESKLAAAALSPDGRWVAGAGWTGYAWNKDVSIYLFNRAIGELHKRLGGYGNAILHLCFSPDGRYLGASLYDYRGLRVWAMDGLRRVLADRDYGDSSWWCAFAADGRLIATSLDGYLRLYAGGTYVSSNGNNPALVWADAGRGPRRAYPVAQDTLMDLRPLPDGGLVVGAGDPAWVVLDARGRQRLARRPATPNLRNKLGNNFTLSPDGTRLRFGLGYSGKQPVPFDLAHPGLEPAPQADPSLAPPRTEGLPITGWENTTEPRLDGRVTVAVRLHDRSGSSAPRGCTSWPAG
jgi:WD40 repeat protein